MGELLSLLSPSFDKIFPVPVFYGVLVLLGFFIGVLTGLFGVGGGFLVVPLLNILVGIPYDIAVGSSLSFIIGTSTAALPGHLHKGNVEPKAVLYISFGSIFGAVFGDVLQDFIIYTVAEGDKAVFTAVMHWLFVVLLMITAWLVYRGPRRESEDLTLLQRLRIGPRTDFKFSGITDVSIPGLAGIGFFVGMLTGLLGVGGGVLFMPILLLVVGLGTRHAVGTSLGVVLAASVAGAAKKVFSAVPKISLPVTMALLIGSSIGVQIGIKLGDVLHTERIRKYFALVVLAAVLLILVNLFVF
jgi:hypothetical protein